MLGLGLKIPKLRTSGLAAWLRAFIKRVKEDGGTVEGKACVKADGEFLINNTRAGIIIEALGDYSKAQGGDGLVNKTCSEIAVNDLLFDPKPQTRFLFLSQDKNLELADYFCLNADVDALEGQFAVKGSVSNSYGSPTRGEVVLSLYNGTAPYTYKWSNGATTQNVANLAKGDYWVQATDANGNVANNKFTILGDADPAIVTQGLRMDSYFSANSLDFPALGSAEFNGTSDYITMGSKHVANDLGITDALTMGAWVYVSDTSDYKPVLAIWDNVGARIFWFGRNPSEGIHYNLGLSGGNRLKDIITPDAVDKWVYMNVTYDGANIRVYQDGSLLYTEAATGTVDNQADPNNFTGVLNIGDQENSSNIYAGSLANVCLWNRALNSDEINSIMWKSYSELDAVQKNGLQAWYALDDITGTTVPDSTGNHNGTAN